MWEWERNREISRKSKNGIGPRNYKCHNTNVLMLSRLPIHEICLGRIEWSFSFFAYMCVYITYNFIFLLYYFCPLGIAIWYVCFTRFLLGCIFCTGCSSHEYVWSCVCVYVAWIYFILCWVNFWIPSSQLVFSFDRERLEF